MAAFSYRAINAAGKVVNGTIEGDTERQVRTQLRAQKLKPINVDGVKQKQQKAAASRSLFAPRMKIKELTLLTRQMASLVQSGMPLSDALQGVAKQSRKESTKGLVMQIRSRVLEGLSLAKAFGEHPRSFDSMFIAMVNAGEQAGFLGPVLERLAEHTENSQFAKQKLTTAMVYPMMLMLICVGIVIALMAFVVPQMTTVFERSDAELPGITQFLIASSDFVLDYWLFVMVGFMLIIVVFNRWVSAPANLKRWHSIKLKLPIFGHIIVQSDTARFAGTLSMLLDSGVPLLQALRISSQTMNNLVLREKAEEVSLAVQEGSSLNRALDQAEVFPPLLVQMASSGEANGTLAEQLKYSASTQERELDMQLTSAMSILEPLTILVMASVVGFIMFAIMKPIFGMVNLL